MNGRFDEHCTMCGCTITRKTASLSSDCGIQCCNPEGTCDCKKTNLKKYNQQNGIVMEPKWLAFKNKNHE